MRPRHPARGSSGQENGEPGPAKFPSEISDLVPRARFELARLTGPPLKTCVTEIMSRARDFKDLGRWHKLPCQLDLAASEVDIVVQAEKVVSIGGLSRLRRPRLEHRRSLCYAPLLDGLDQDRTAPQGPGLRSPPRAPRGREWSRPA